ncbi:MAG: Ca2+-dependent phosphoinositide-specific phospholipase C [Bryobacteraceae bacterium]|nr:Ca2+-dependent phosphoinositide-specific phospholipase C [Bryobacteraceae bacterium]
MHYRPILTMAGLIPLLAPIAHAQLPQGYRESPPLHHTWRLTVHNAFWHGQPGVEAGAGGPKQHLLDSLYIDRARGLEFDLHADHAGKKFDVYHTDREDFSLCQIFNNCLDVVRAWHFGNPAHDPFFLHIEAKEFFPTDPFFREDGLKPQDLDAVMSEKLQDAQNGSWLFTPKHYLDWCSTRGWVAKFPDPNTRPDYNAYIGENLQAAMPICGWPTMDELRGKVIVVFHGSWAHNEFHVYDYTNKYGRGLRGVVAFTMAGVIGVDSDTTCWDYGTPGPIRWGNVCNWQPQTGIVDLLTLDVAELRYSPFGSDPSAFAKQLQQDNFYFRSKDRNSKSDILAARSSLYDAPGTTGFNNIAGDGIRNNPLNDPAHYPIGSFAAGCLLGPSARPCNQNSLVEPSSAIQLVGRATSTTSSLNGGSTSDQIFGVFRPVKRESGNFRAHISTRTYEENHGSTYTGRYGCVMAREDLAPNSPFVAICRLKHRLSWGVNDQGIIVLYRGTRGAGIESRYLDTATFPNEDPLGDSSGVPELDAYVYLGHSADGKSWEPAKRITDDPSVRYDQLMRRPDGTYWTFTQPLNYIGLITDGGSLTEDGLIGDYLFSNVRYNGTYQRLADLPIKMETPGFTASATDRSSLDGVCAADVSGWFDVVGGGFQRIGFTSNYMQRIRVTNKTGRDLVGPFRIAFSELPTNARVSSTGAVTGTCREPFEQGMELNIPGGVLPTGQSVQIDVQFNNPGGQQLSYKSRIRSAGRF